MVSCRTSALLRFGSLMLAVFAAKEITRPFVRIGCLSHTKSPSLAGMFEGGAVITYLPSGGKAQASAAAALAFWTKVATEVATSWPVPTRWSMFHHSVRMLAKPSIVL